MIAFSNRNKMDSLSLFYSEMNNISHLSEEEELRLFQDIKEGKNPKEAVYKIVSSNLRLVDYIARKYVCDGMDRTDFINEGYIGLENAVMQFDVTKGYKFSTYASECIKNAIIKAITKKGHSIRIPGNMMSFLCRIDKVQEQFMIKNGRRPSIEELAEKMNVSVDKIKEMLSYMCVNKVSSLDVPVGDDEGVCRSDFLMDCNASIPYDDVSKESLRSFIAMVVDELPEREAEIIRYRFGFWGREYSLEEIGEMYNLTRERIRQIIEHAFKSIRRNRDVYEQLEDYCYEY